MHEGNGTAMIARTQTALGRLVGMARGGGLRAQLVRGAMGSAGVQAASRVLALVLGIILARTLGPTGFGIYVYAFAIMSLLMVAAEAGVPTLLMREVAAAGAREEWGLVRGALRRGVQFVALVSVGLSGLGLIVLAWLGDGMEPAPFWTMALMLLVLPLAALGKTIAFALRGLHRVVTAQALEMLLRPALVIAVVAAVFHFAPDLRTPPTAMAAQLGAVAVMLLFAIARLKRVTPSAATAVPARFRSREWLKSALPFVLLGGAGVIKSQTDMVMIGWYMEGENVGYYRVSVQGALLVVLGSQIANSVTAPQFSKLHAIKDYRRLQILAVRSAQGMFLFALLVLATYLLAGEQLISWVFGVKYGRAYLPLVILSFGHLIHAAFGSVDFLLNMTGHESRSASLFWQAAALNIVLNLALIPVAGEVGAATATALSQLFWVVRMASAVRKRLGIFPSILGGLLGKRS